MSLRRLAALAICITLALCAAAAPRAAAQTAAFASWKTQVSVGPPNVATEAGQITVTPNRDIFVCDRAAAPGDVVKYPATGGSTTIALPGADAVPCDGLASDPAGNVYVSASVSSGSGLMVIPAGSTTASVLPVTGVIQSTNPGGLSVAGGELYVADPFGNSIGNGVVYKIPTGTSGGAATVIFDNSSVQTSATQYTTVAADAAGNVFVGVTLNQSGGNTVGVFKCASTCTGTGGTWSALSAIPGPTVESNSWSDPQQMVVDPGGNLYVANYNNKGNAGTGGTGTYTAIIKVSTPLATPAYSIVDNAANYYQGVALDTDGNLHYTYNQSAGTGASGIVELGLAGVNFGFQTTQSTSASIPVTFTVSGSGTLGTTLILTQGTAASDFADGGASTCSNFVAPGSCTVNVTFTPSAPGLRPGAVVLVDGSGNRLATAFLEGTGVGAGIDFSVASPTPTTLVSITGANNAGGVLANASGVYYVNGFTNSLVQFSGGSFSQAASSGTMDQIAQDGAGNIYFAEVGAMEAERVDAKTGVVTHPGGVLTTYVHGVAVDGQGNLFISDQNAHITEILAANIAAANGVATYNITYTATGSMLNIAPDGAGNVFFANASTIGELNLASSAVTTFATVSGENLVGLALEPGGAVYAGDQSGFGLLRISPTGASYQSIFTNSQPHSIALDAQGNVYYEDQHTSPVSLGELTLATPPSLAFGSVALGASSASQTVAVNNTGNQPLNFSIISVPAGFTLGSGAGTCAVGTPVAAGGFCNLVVTFSPVQGNDGVNSPNLVLTDTAGTGSQSIPLTGTGTQTPTALHFEVKPPSAIFAGGNLGTVKVDILDANGLLDADESTQTITVTIADSGSFNQVRTSTASNGVATLDLSGIALPTAENYTVTATDTPDALTQDQTIATVIAPSVAFAATALGSNIASTPVTVLITTAGTTGSSGVAVLTQGQPGLDYTNATGGTCAVSTPYTAGQTCSVNVKFAPSAAGLRKGAVVLYDGSGNPLGTAFLSGVGNGAVAAFPGVASTVVANSDVSTGLAFMSGLASDGTNFYTGSTSYGRIFKITSGGVISQICASCIPTGVGASSVALDGAGNLFELSDTGTQSLLEFVNHNGTLSATPITYGSGLNIGGGNTYDLIAVDGAGNVDVAEQNAGNIWQYPAGGAARVNLVSGLGTNFHSISIDPSGNIYFVSGGSIERIPAGRGAAVTITGAVGVRGATAFDAAGNLYTSSPVSSNQVTVYSISGTTATQTAQYTIPGSSTFADGMVLDSAGNIYVGDDGSDALDKITVSAAPASFAFSTTQANGTTSAPQTTTLTNIGNGTLSFTSVASTNSGFVASGCGTDLAPGASCTESVVFSPTSTSPWAGALDFHDNAPVNASTQEITLSGTSLATTLTLVSGSSQTARVSTAFATALVVNVTDSNSAPVQGLTVSFAGSGGSTVTATTGVGGNATAIFTANATAGAFTVTATAPDAGNSVTFSLTNVNPASKFLITPAATAVVAGTPFNFAITAQDNLSHTDPFYTGIVTYSATGSGNTLPGNAALSQGVGDFSATLGTGGIQTLTATDTVTNTITGSTDIQVQPLIATAPTETVGTASGTQTVTFVSPGTAIGTGGIKVLTNGLVSASDFVVAGGGTCVVGTQGGASCTVNYTFTPSVPGLRRGAVVLYDGSGNPLATVLLSGVGNGALAAYLPQDPSTAAHNLATGLTSIIGLASDGTSLYFSQAGSVNTISSMPIGGGSATALISSGLTAPGDLALDGAGNLYVADTGAGAINKYPRKADGSFGAVIHVATSVTGLSDIAVDALGNVFAIANTGNLVEEFPAIGGAAVQIDTTTGSQFAGIGVNQAGDLYYGFGSSEIIPNKVTAANLAAGAPFTKTSQEVQVGSGVFAFDAAGDLVANDGAEVEIFVGSSGHLQNFQRVGDGPTFNQVVLDGTGNIYASDTAGNIAFANLRAPSYSYGNVLVGQTNDPNDIAFVFDAGNVNLTITAVTSSDPTHFVATGDVLPKTLTPFTAGQIYQPDVRFTPDSATTFNATETITDNDYAGTTQTIGLNGAGLGFSLAATAGTPQLAHINAGFTNPLVVTATDTLGHPAVGVSVTFTAPASGASGTFSSTTNTITVTTPSNGIVSEVFTANGTPSAAYSVTATASGATANTSFTLTNVGPATHFALTGATSPEVAGVANSVLVTALDANNLTDTTYAGTVHFTSTDPRATLPSDATLASGSQSFGFTLISAGNRAVTGTDTITNTITGTSSVIAVTPAAAARLVLGGPGNANTSTAFNVQVTALDAYSNVVGATATVPYTAAVTITSSDSAAVLPAPATLANGQGIFSLTFKTGGSQTITATDNGGSPLTVTSAAIGVFPLTSNVGTAVTSIPVVFTFTGSTAVRSISVLTQGKLNGDFTASGTQPGNTCIATTYTAGQSCVLHIDFTPTAPGLRAGAVVLADINHATLATAYISGLGTGPAIAFTGGAQTVLDGTDFSGPRSLAIDGSGNYYVADSTKGKIYLIPAGTVSGTGTDIGYTPAHTIQGIALDGAGNLYVAQNSGSTSTSTAELVKIPLENGILNQADKTTIGTYAPTAVATDSQGNVYIFDAATLNIYQINPAGAATTVANPSGANGHFSDTLALGPDGTIYFVAAGEEFSKYAPGNFSHSYITNFAGEGVLSGVAADVAGDIFVTTSGSGNLYEMAPFTATQTTLASSSSTLRAVVLDPSGNAYYLDGTGFKKLDLADAPTLAFGNVPSHPTTPPLLSTTVSNVGNADLAITAIAAAPSQYTIGGTCTSSTTLAASTGQTCTAGASFSPDAINSFSGTVSLTDNAYTGTSQTVNLSGSGVTSIPTFIVTPHPGATFTYGTDLTFDVSVSSATSNLPASSSGNYTVDGGAAVPFNYTNGAITGLDLGVLAASSSPHTIQFNYVGDSTFSATSSPSQTITVNKAILTVAPTPHSFVYGVTPTFLAPVLTTDYTFGPFVNGDTASVVTGAPALSTIATAATPVATPGIITIGVGSLAAANYTFDTSATAALTMTRAPLTVTLVPQTLPYGTDYTQSTFTAGALGTNFTIGGYQNSETSSVVSGGITLAATATSTSPVSGSPYQISQAASTLAAANYTFSTPAPVNLTVAKAVLTIVPTAQSLPYGTNFNAAAGLAIPVEPTGFSLSGFANGENETSAGVSGSPVLTTTAGPTTAVATGGTIAATAGTLTAANYSFSPGTPGTLTITALPLTASLVGGPFTKVYDSFNNLTLTSANYALPGAINGDIVTLAAFPNATFNTTQVSTATTITSVGTLALTGANAGNYTLANTSASAAGTITPAPVTVAITGAPSMPYNGTTTSTNILSGSNYQINGLVATDIGQVSLLSTPLSGTYNDPTVAGATTITVTGLGLSSSGAGTNYSFASGTASGPATITAATITPGLQGGVSKTYDTTTAATLTVGNYNFIGAVPGDSSIFITTPTSGTYNDKTVNANKLVTVTGIALQGTTAPNYVIANGGTVSGNIGVITAAALTVSLTGSITKVYDGQLGVTLTGGNYSLSAPLGGDVVSLNTTPATGVFAAAGVSLSPIAVSSNGSATLQGTDASNYALANGGVAQGIGTITPAPLTVTADPVSIAFGSALPTYTATISGFVNSETGPSNGGSNSANVTGTPTFSTTPTTPSAIGAYPITPAVGTLAAANYSFTNFVNGTLAIRPAPITMTATAVGQTSASVPVTFPFSADTTVTAVGVLSNGATDFASTDSGNCVNSFTAPASCTVDVTFTPAAPGLRSGAVVLYGAGNAVLQTIYLSGTGQGALLNVPSAYALHSYGSGVAAAGGFIVAGAANNSYALVSGTVIQINQFLSQNNVLTGLTGYTAIAFDGAGNLFAVSPAGITEVPNENGTLNLADASPAVSASNLTALVVDGAGDLFYTAAGSAAVTEQASIGGVTTLGSNLAAGSPLALDGAGNLYAVELSGSIAKITPAGVQTDIATSVTGITALQADAAGDIFVASPSGIVELPATATSSPQTVWGGAITSMALDSQGDIFALNPYSGLDGFLAGVPSSTYTYPLTAIQQSLPASETVVNQGNAPLTFSAVSVGTSNFAIDSSNACSTSASIAPGAICALNFDFTPTTNGPLSDTLSLASDSFVNPSASFPLAGTGALIVQNITFAPAATATYGDAPIALSATSDNSGIPVVLSLISGPATLNGSTLTITGNGTIVVAADQAGDSIHAAAAQVQATITVAKAALTVTADAKSRVYGAANPTFTDQIAGFVNGETSSVIAGTPVLATIATASTGVGTAPITVDVTGMSATNYTFTGVPGALTITTAPLTVTPDPATRVYGVANPSFTGTVATVLNGDGITASYASQAVAATSVGAYATGTNAITATLSDPNNKLGNYAVTNNPGTLTITAAPITAAISGPVNKTYDGTNVARVAQAFSLPGILTADLPNAVPSYTATYSQANVGSGLTVTASGISLTGAAAGNYSLTSTTATGTGSITALTITPGLIGSITKAYDATISATVGAANIVLPEVLSSDASGVSAAAATASYDTATVGSGKSVTAIGISLSGAAAANYLLAPTTASANIGAITQATLTFAANNLTRAYGVSNPTLAYTVTGFQGLDGVSSFSGNPTRTTAATTTSGVGNYPITIAAGDLVSTNYAFAFVPGSLAITPAALTPAILGAVNKTYDGTNTAHLAQSFSITGILTADLPNAVPSFTAAYSQANVGTGLSVTASNIALAGTAAANYSLTTTTVTGTGSITPAVITVPADPKTRVYGAANPTFTSLITGFVNGQDASVITGAPIFATTAVASTSVGTAPITVDVSGMSATNYTFTGVPGVLTITQASLAFSANNLSRVYGSVNPTLAFTVTGFQNGDSVASAFSGNPDRTTTATAASGVGNYPITIAAGTLASTNYAFTFVNGSLAVTPATLTVTANNLTRAYNSANPAATSTLSGLLNGDPATVVTGAPVYSFAATTTTDVGTSAITPSLGTLASPNYTFAFAPGTLTITQASQTVTFNPIGFAVPGSVVALNATATSGLAVTFKVDSGSATVSGANLTVTGPGAITVEADQIGNNDYLAATPVAQTFSAGAPAVTLSASLVSFASQTINTTSAAQTVVVTNSGTSALHVSTATAEAPFAASTNCSTVAAGASCSVSITFNPTTSGNASGTLTITDDASTTPQLVALTGVGAAPGISLTPGILTFGGQPVGTSSTPQSLTILNTGSSPLNISSVSFTLPTGVPSTDFAVAGGCATIAAGSSCSLAVTFTPTAAGTRTVAITLADNAGTGTQMVFAVGTGTAAGVSVSPSALAFPPALVGSTSFPLTVTVTNTGTAPLTGLSGSIQGDFNLASSTCTSTLAAGASCTATITSTPSLAGAETGTLTVTDSLGTQPVALSSTGLSPGANLGASQLVFGGQLAGTVSGAQTIVLTNSGTGALSLTSVAVSNGFAQTSNCSTALAAGASCGINVSFTPSVSGSANGTLTVVDSAGTQTAALAGVGTSPGLALTPSSVNFGAQQVNTSSQAQTLTLANTGTVALTLNPRAATGDFTEADSCPATLAAGATCQISLSFAPSALGSRSGSIAIGDASGLASTLASLGGVGTLPGLSASPTSLFFGGQNVATVSPAQTVTITNTGTAALTVSSVQTSGDFSAFNTCTLAAINPGSTCVISVTMTPTGAGARTGTLSVYDNADGLRIISLSGTGQAPGASIAPNALAFGSAPIPAPGSAITLTGTPQTVTLTNSGSAPLAIASILINGDFTQNNTCGASLAAGQSCSINIGFSPTGLGHRTGVLAIFDNSASGTQIVTLAGDGSPTGLTLSPSALNFGGAAVGVPSAPQTATLNNATGSAITGLAITASGEFSETDTCGTSLANGASCTLSIVLTPLTSSGITGTISIAGSIANSSSSAAAEIRSASLRSAGFRSEAAPVTSGLAVVALSGSGNPAGIQLSAATLTFASQPVGSASAAQTVTITNTGSSDALTTLTLTSTPDFPITTTCAATLAAGANCTAAVAFNPTAAGTRSGALTISADGGLTAQVALSGTATGGILNVSPSTLAFGARAIGTLSAAQTITISNSGTAALTLQPLALAGGDFALASNTCSTTLAAGASCAAAITYTPSTSGTSTGTVTITSNSGNAIVALSGSGNTQGLQLSATSFAFGNQGVGLKSAAHTLTLTNQNASAVAITSLTASGDFSETNNCGTSVAAGASCAVQLAFTPTATGARAGTVAIVNSGATQSAALSGTGTNYAAAVVGSSSQSVDAGRPATYNLTYTPGAFTGTVALACSGLPAGANCSFSPASLNLVAGAAASTVALTITTTSRSGAIVPVAPPSTGPSPGLGPLAWTLLAGLLGTLTLLLLAAFQPRRRRSWAMSALVFGALAAAGCGGVSNLANANGGTPPGTYTITVTATAGSATQTTNVTLSVN